jgi:hypothetical protein
MRPPSPRATSPGPRVQPPRPGPVAPQPRRPATRSRPRPNWAGRLVAGLVVLALVVVVVVLAQPKRPSATSGPGPGTVTGTGTGSAGSPIHIQAVSVFHTERNADSAATVGNAIDGNPATAWTTDHYFTRFFGGLHHGLGLAMVLDSRQALHTLSVLSPTVGWSAEVYVADSVPDPPALAPWGPPVAARQGGSGTTTFDLGGRRGGAILFWLTDLGPGAQTSIDELSLR